MPPTFDDHFGEFRDVFHRTDRPGDPVGIDHRLPDALLQGRDLDFENPEAMLEVDLRVRREGMLRVWT